MAYRSSNAASSSVGVTSINVAQPPSVATGDVVVCALQDDDSGTLTIGLPASAVELPSSPKSSNADSGTT